MISKLKKDIFIVVELINPKNVSFLYNKGRTQNDEYLFIKNGMKIDSTASFAAGEVYFSSIMDNLLVQAYYNESLLAVLKKVIVGEDQSIYKKPPLSRYKQIISSNLYLINNPFDSEEKIREYLNINDYSTIYNTNYGTNNNNNPSVANKVSSLNLHSQQYNTNTERDIVFNSTKKLMFQDIFNFFIKKGILVIGVYRSIDSVGFPKAQPYFFDKKYSNFYFVYTSPDKKDLIDYKDKFFVLSQAYPPENILDNYNSIAYYNNTQEHNNPFNFIASNLKKFEDKKDPKIESLDKTGLRKVKEVTGLLKDVQNGIDDLSQKILDIHGSIESNIQRQVRSKINSLYGVKIKRRIQNDGDILEENSEESSKSENNLNKKKNSNDNSSNDDKSKQSKTSKLTNSEITERTEKSEKSSEEEDNNKKDKNFRSLKSIKYNSLKNSETDIKKHSILKNPFERQSTKLNSEAQKDIKDIKKKLSFYKNNIDKNNISELSESNKNDSIDNKDVIKITSPLKKVKTNSDNNNNTENKLNLENINNKDDIFNSDRRDKTKKNTNKSNKSSKSKKKEKNNLIIDRNIGSDNNKNNLLTLDDNKRTIPVIKKSEIFQFSESDHSHNKASKKTININLKIDNEKTEAAENLVLNKTFSSNMTDKSENKIENKNINEEKKKDDKDNDKGSNSSLNEEVRRNYRMSTQKFDLDKLRENKEKLSKKSVKENNN